MHELGMVYFAIVGGAAALETTQIEEIEEVLWEELMPECLWKFRVKDFGPLTVGIDAHGNSWRCFARPSDVEPVDRRARGRLAARDVPRTGSRSRCSFPEGGVGCCSTCCSGLEPKARVFAIDTHHLFPETYELWRKVQQRYSTTVEVFETGR